MANIFETARAERRANKFSRGLDSAAGLAQTLSGPGPFTIFVPTDAAFDQLSADQQANLLDDPGKLTKLLQYHIVPGLYKADDMLDQHLSQDPGGTAPQSVGGHLRDTSGRRRNYNGE